MMQKIPLHKALTAVDRYKLFLLAVTPKDIDNTLRALKQKGVPVIDIGFTLSKFLNGLRDKEYLHLEAYDHLKKILELEKKRVTSNSNEVVMIYNLGMLLEPMLDLNAIQLFKEFSKTAVLIIMWEHSVSDHNILSWPSHRDRFHFDFSELQLKYIEDAL